MTCDHLDPFVESAHHLFTAMLSCGAKKGKLEAPFTSALGGFSLGVVLDLNGQRRQSK
jgi:hypothetical protein